MVAVPVITSGGATLPDEFALVSLEVVREIDRVPYARLLFDDADIAAGKWPSLEADALKPGAALDIKVREDDVTTALFQGLVVRLGLEVTDGSPMISVEAKDKAFRLTRPRRTAIFTDSTDADAIGKILTNAGVTRGDLGPDGTSQPSLVQYDSSDWDFIQLRARANGLAVVVTDGELSLKPLSLDGAEAAQLHLGIDAIEEIELELDASDQYPGIEATGWDLPAQALTDPTAAAALALKQGDVAPADAGDAIGLNDAVLAHLAPLGGSELKAWASAELARARLGMIRGRVRVPGTGAVALLDLVKLAGVSTRFNGSALVTGVRQSIDSGGWRTDLKLGLSVDPAPAQRDISSPPAAGLLPPAQGLRIGLVSGFQEDDTGEYRVRVRLPGAGDSNELWARLATPEAGDKRGFVFRPEVGDEVIVGFLADDPRQPVILGALFGSKNAPDAAYKPADTNAAKGIRTKNGIELALNDQDKPVVALKTPASAITLDDDKKELRLADGNGNSLVLNDKGVTITSAAAFKLNADGKVAIKGESVDVN